MARSLSIIADRQVLRENRGAPVHICATRGARWTPPAAATISDAVYLGTGPWTDPLFPRLGAKLASADRAQTAFFQCERIRF